ncbi:FAD-dependent oxidoreductase [uncultured Mycolicibacterium sp.]|uniref:FAD-dependent oxidoreductase n=1 Tax=uncultured Mycolicibacterium sp. TaxID=2320817 RepID=UPI0026122352|nr:FAD-dependent oxidoreductase [uncultured Mycolicibacterium sp.]
MNRPQIAVAGSGLAGLHTAAHLAPAADVTVYERLPVAGGEHWQDPTHTRLVERTRRAGVRFAPGTQVIRWEGDRLLAVGSGGGLAAADALVIATGHRPPTRAELRIDGHRCAGVVPATVALHLLQQRVTLGVRIVVAGETEWARSCIETFTAAGASVLWVGGPAADPRASVTARPQARVTTTHGMPRITGVTVTDGTGDEHVPCDCLVLAGPPLPYRNVDGAVLDDAPVVYAQRRGDGIDDPARIGERAAREALALAQHHPRTRTAVSPRIGQPL